MNFEINLMIEYAEAEFEGKICHTIKDMIDTYKGKIPDDIID